MAYCIRCGYKCSFFKSLGLKDGSICKDCLDELGITPEEKSKYGSMTASYELLLADLRFKNPGVALPAPEQRSGDDYQPPVEMPIVRTYGEMLDEYYIEDPKVNLDVNEKCYYKGTLTLSFKRIKKVVTGGGSYSGISISLGHGIRYGVGGRSPVKTKNKEVTISEPVTFYMTSKRFYFEVKGQFFSIYYKDIDSLTWNIKSFDVISGSDSLNFSTVIMPVGDIERVYYLIQQKNKEDELTAPKKARTKSKKSSNQTKSDSQDNNAADPIQMIREYKKLLDEGILTQEEFDKKKAEILNL